MSANICKCGSYAINPGKHGRDTTDQDLCDVCYWRTRAEKYQQRNDELLHQHKNDDALNRMLVEMLERAELAGARQRKAA